MVRTRLLLALGPALLLGAVAEEVERGFDHFYNLEFEQSVAAFARLAKENPGSAELHNHLAQALLYRELLKAGALETELVTGGNAFLRGEKMNPSAADQKAFDGAIETSLRITAQRLAASPSDKDALYAQGVAHGLRANYNFLVRKSWLDALRDATACRKLHDRVTGIDPAMVDARMTQGVHDYIVGSLSWSYRLLGFLVGFRGDKARGVRTVEEVFRKGDKNRADAAILLATVYRRERRPADAVPVLEWLIARYPRNYLFHFELAQMHSDLGNKERALAAVAAVERLKAAGSPGFDKLPVEKIVYYRSTIQFWYGDLDDALAGFSRVSAKAADLDPNTGVTAWMRLGQTHDLKGQRRQAVAAYRKAIAMAPGSYRAKESEVYLRRPFRRD